MKLCILAAGDRSPSSNVDAAMLDGDALAATLRSSGHEVDLEVLPHRDATLLQRAVALAETATVLARLAVRRPAPDGLIMIAPPHLAALCADLVANARGIPGAVVLTAMTTEARLRSGELGGGTWESRLLPLVEDALVRRARVLMVPNASMARTVAIKGADSHRVHALPEMFAPLVARPEDARITRLRSDLGEGAACLVLLPAALGAATDLGGLMGALTRLQHDKGIAVAAVGGGSRAASLRDMVEARGIRNARVVHLSRQDRRAAVHAADVLLGVAVPSQDGLCVPRAVSRALWAGKPLVAAGPENSELVKEVRRLGLGPTVGLGDAEGLATVLRTLASDRSQRDAYAAAARTAGAHMQSPAVGLIRVLQGSFEVVSPAPSLAAG